MIESALTLLNQSAPQLILREFRAGNVFIREMLFTHRGVVVDGHRHNFGHVTYIPRGAALFEELDDDDNVVRSAIKRASEGTNYAFIKAGVRHRITALEDQTIGHCIFSHRTPQGEVVLDYDGWKPAYL